LEDDPWAKEKSFPHFCMTGAQDGGFPTLGMPAKIVDELV
jgi:hypothetical protein